MGIRWHGMKELQSGLKDAAKLEAVKRIVLQNGSEMQQASMRLVPVDTGTLKRSINLSIEDDGLTAVLTPRASYAPYVEYGTRFAEAQPFVRPAFDRQAVIFKRDIEKLTKR